MSWRLIEGDCVDAMAEMPEESVDAVVTDPPYALAFMGKTWDKLGKGRAAQGWHEEWAREALYALKPGGHLLAFGGTRTYHRLACAIEDAGFEIRDMITWMYGQGFPKSLDVAKAISETQTLGSSSRIANRRAMTGDSSRSTSNGSVGTQRSMLTAPSTPPPRMNLTPGAKQWDGWGTALKPAHESIVVARKPLAGTVAKNVTENGTGALNIDACRIGQDTASVRERAAGASGRWPANVALDEEAAVMLDGDTTGGASRFFYCAKTSRRERNAGLDGFEPRWAPTMNGGIGNLSHDEDVATPKRNVHPTVKPIALMRWLVRLVTPPGGLVLDPFAGSGTTGIAAVSEGFSFVGIEKSDEYADIARARIDHWAPRRYRRGRAAQLRKATAAVRD